MILLDPYAARSCPVKTFNAFDPTVPAPVLDESLQESFQGGADWREQILNEFATITGAVDLRKKPSLEATRAAVEAGAAIILRPTLPPDVEGHRCGHTDALLRDPNSPEPRYLPLKTKPYRVWEKQLGTSDLQAAPLKAPTEAKPMTNRRFRSYREGVLLELAHTWRMLQAASWGSQTPRVAIVGTPQIGNPFVLWVSLEHKFIRTFSRTAGYKLRSPLERYEHEHRFRVYIAQVAASRTGSGDPAPAVRPIRVKECESCAWWERCRTRMDDDDLSLRIAKAPLDVRELQTLLSFGIHTVAQLAKADLDEILPKYLPRTQHRNHSEERLRQAQRRARMIEQGVELERVSADPIAVPRAAVEIDLDIETASDGSVYLWGCLVSGLNQRPTYVPFVRFNHHQGDGELALAGEFAAWLVELVERHPDIRIYHYSDYEVVHLRRLAERSGNPVLHRAVTLIAEHFVDLYQYVKENFVSVNGLGLKVVASRGAGFAWRDEDPGGLQSQTWFEEACDPADKTKQAASQRRVLEYNEDDVRATYVLRDWMTRLDEHQGRE